MFFFYTPKKLQESNGFLKFSGCIAIEMSEKFFIIHFIYLLRVYIIDIIYYNEFFYYIFHNIIHIFHVLKIYTIKIISMFTYLHIYILYILYIHLYIYYTHHTYNLLHIMRNRYIYISCIHFIFH